MALDTGSVIALLLGSSVLSAVINQVWTTIRDHRKQKREKSFSALYVAIALEAYASECASLIQDSTNFENSDGHAGTPQGNVAELPDFPEAVEWKPLGIKLTTRAMTFRVDVDTTRTWFKGAWEFGDEDDIVPEVRERSALLGSSALALAKELRRKHGIDPVSYEGKWDVGEYLETSYADHVKKRKEHEERQRKFNEEMWGKIATPPVVAEAEAGVDQPPTEVRT